MILKKAHFDCWLANGNEYKFQWLLVWDERIAFAITIKIMKKISRYLVMIMFVSLNRFPSTAKYLHLWNATYTQISPASHICTFAHILCRYEKKSSDFFFLVNSKWIMTNVSSRTQVVCSCAVCTLHVCLFHRSHNLIHEDKAWTKKNYCDKLCFFLLQMNETFEEFYTRTLKIAIINQWYSINYGNYITFML